MVLVDVSFNHFLQIPPPLCFFEISDTVSPPPPSPFFFDCPNKLPHVGSSLLDFPRTLIFPVPPPYPMRSPAFFLTLPTYRREKPPPCPPFSFAARFFVSHRCPPPLPLPHPLSQFRPASCFPQLPKKRVSSLFRASPVSSFKSSLLLLSS